jgi:NADPH:quinone reductase-like Zn-dependent oxidoreductase
MNAWFCNDSRPVPGLVVAYAEVPEPGPGELSIRVHAAGVTPSELVWYPTTHVKDGGNRLAAIPGHEFSGVIAAVGTGVDMAVGQEVFGMNDWFADGATAEFCCAPQSAVARKPATLTHIAAASIPIGALTAWQGLFDRAKLQSGERVLIHGGSGAVGVFAIQLARRAGASVITTASSRNQDLLMRLGAQQIIDYHTQNFEEIVNEIDVVFDGVGGSTLYKSWDVLRPGGRLVTIAASSELEMDERTKQAFFIVEPDQVQLHAIARLLEERHLEPVIDAVVPFDQAALAYAGKVPGGHGCGKTVISMTPP